MEHLRVVGYFLLNRIIFCSFKRFELEMRGTTIETDLLYSSGMFHGGEENER